MGVNNTATFIDRLARWVADEVAPALDLYAPVEGDLDGNMPERIHPSVHVAFVPPEGMLAGDRTAPSITVLPTETIEGVGLARRTTVALYLTLWNPGHWDADGNFTASMDGWRDVANAMDVVVDKVMSAETIAGRSVDYTVGITHGLMNREKEIPSFYPFWLARVTFVLQGGAPLKSRKTKYQQFL